MEAGMALLAAGSEHVGNAMDGLGLAANAGADGTSTAASVGGGASHYETGSHVKSHTWNAAVAVGRNNETKKGSLEYGIFGEYGKSSYTLHSDAGRGMATAITQAAVFWPGGRINTMCTPRPASVWAA